MFTRQHYEKIAAVIAAERAKLDCDPAYVDAQDAIVGALADMFAADNPRFNRGVFVNACHVGRPLEAPANCGRALMRP